MESKCFINKCKLCDTCIKLCKNKQKIPYYINSCNRLNNIKHKHSCKECSIKIRNDLQKITYNELNKYSCDHEDRKRFKIKIKKNSVLCNINICLICLDEYRKELYNRTINPKGKYESCTLEELCINKIVNDPVLLLKLANYRTDNYIWSKIHSQMPTRIDKYKKIKYINEVKKNEISEMCKVLGKTLHNYNKFI
jgi:hypothetical protein